MPTLQRALSLLIIDTLPCSTPEVSLAGPRGPWGWEIQPEKERRQSLTDTEKTSTVSPTRRASRDRLSQAKHSPTEVRTEA